MRWLVICTLMGCYFADDREEHRDLEYAPTDVPKETAMSEAERALYGTHYERFHRWWGPERAISD
jgi:hypothetical protein